MFQIVLLVFELFFRFFSSKEWRTVFSMTPDKLGYLRLHLVIC